MASTLRAIGKAFIWLIDAGGRGETTLSYAKWAYRLWVGGGVLGAIAVALGRDPDEIFLFAVIGAVGFGVSGLLFFELYDSWLVHHRASKERRMLDDGPLLSGQIEQMLGVLLPFPDGSKVLNIFQVASIINQGQQPSLAEGFYLTIDTGTKRISNLVSFVIEDEFTLVFPASVLSIAGKSESLAYRTSTPIASGERRFGWIRFVAPNFTLAEALAPSTRFMLHFRDVLGRECVATTSNNERDQSFPSMHRTFPGLEIKIGNLPAGK